MPSRDADRAGSTVRNPGLRHPGRPVYRTLGYTEYAYARVRLSSEPEMQDEYELIRPVRGLYLRMLTLESTDTRARFVQDALSLMTELVDGDQGYLELRGSKSEEAKVWTSVKGLAESDLEEIKPYVSGTIKQSAYDSARIMRIEDARLDPRFQGAGSIKAGTIASVICAPIGFDARLGVVYLHASGSPFTSKHEELVEVFARDLAPIALQIVTDDDTHTDPTARFREKLQADDLVGRSPALAGVLEQILHVARSGRDGALLTGPAGSGKTAVARIIHENSERDGDFVHVNCGALTPDLAASELLGYVAGAFTGARSGGKDGYLGIADGGTLFLDEVAELPAAAQTALLTAISEGYFKKVGGAEDIASDVKVLAATNKSLQELIDEGRFEFALYDRLAVWEIEMPPLSAIREDIPAIAERMIERICEDKGCAPLSLHWEAAVEMMAADWQANFRTLENTLRRAVAFALFDESDVVERWHVFPKRFPDRSVPLTLKEATIEFHRRVLAAALEEHGGDATATAAALGISRSRFYELKSQLGLG